jgi:uncharacterized protein (DUF983 family)
VALTTSVLMRRAALKHCPVCNRGHLFRRWVMMADACPTCGLVFRREPGQWLGSWFLNVCVAQMAVTLVLIIGVASTYPNPPMWIIGAVATLSAVVVPVLFFPFSRTVWTAIDLAMRPLEFAEGVDPAFELDEQLAHSRRHR